MIVLLCFAGFATAQEKEHYSPIGLGWCHQTVIDQGMSPLKYAGGGASFLTGYFVRSEQVRYAALLSGHYAGLGTRASTEGIPNSADAIRASLDFEYLRQFRASADDQMNYYLGGHFGLPVNFRWNGRLGNSAANYEGFMSIGASGAISRSLNLNEREADLEWRLAIPLISRAYRPNYSGVFDVNDQADISNDILENNRWVSLNNFIRVNSRLVLSYPLKNGNLLQLGYEWDFYSYKPTHQVNAAMHSIIFTRSFNY